MRPTWPGWNDVAEAASALSTRLPAPLAVFARIAFNYRWAWMPGGPDLFRHIDERRWAACEGRPGPAAPGGDHRVAGPRRPRRASSSSGPRPWRRPSCPTSTALRPGPRPHAAGGLRMRRVRDPLVAPDLLGRPRHAGRRLHEGVLRPGPAPGRHRAHVPPGLFPPAARPGRLADGAVAGRRPRSAPRRAGHRRGRVPAHHQRGVRGRSITAQIWRIDVGRVPLYLLDSDRPENSRVDRWVTARLYVGDRQIRLAQYALLGVGGMRALRAMGIEPGVVHVNEGHGALAALELARAEVEEGRSLRGGPGRGPRARGVHHAHPRGRRATRSTPPPR